MSDRHHTRALKQSDTRKRKVRSKKQLQLQSENGAPTISLDRIVQRTKSAPQSVSPQSVIQLQNTIGNQAVQRVLGLGKKSSSSSKPAAPASAIMPYAQFRRQTGQDRKQSMKERLFSSSKGYAATADMEEIMSGKKGLEDLKADRAAANLPNNKINDTTNAQININHHYWAYDNDPTMAHLVALYNSITFWKTMFNGMWFMPQVEGILNLVLEQIKVQVQSETRKLAGEDAEGMNAAATALVSLNARPKPSPTPMPTFLKDIGLPQGYYDEHLAGNDNAIAALEHFYVELQAGHNFAAAKWYEQVKTVQGMAFVKSLIMAHLPDQSNLKGLVGTQEKEGEVTDAEKAAIITYSGGEFDPMNTQLRNQVTRKAGMVMGNRAARVQPAGPATKAGQLPQPDFDPQDLDNLKGRRERDNKAFNRNTTMKLAVSGMNKLPKYSGVAYRKSPGLPLSTFKPGGTFADLGFMSASPSLTGVDNFSASIADVYFVFRHPLQVSG